MKIQKTLLLFFILVAVLYGQEKPDVNKFYIVFGGGGAILNESDYLTENWNLGYSVSFGMEVSISRLFTYTIIHVQFSRFFLNKENYLNNFFPDISNASIEGRSADMLGLWSNLKLKFFERPKAVFPYLWIGLGIMGMSLNEGTISNRDTMLTLGLNSEIYFSFTGGIGVQYSLSNSISVSINSSYTAGTGFMTPTYINDISYFTLKLGVLVSIGKTCAIPSIPSF
jgi:opacity protein-like surface antigen